LGYVPEATGQALLAKGYSVEGLYSKPLRRQAMEDADIIINMSGGSLDHQFHGHTQDNPHLAKKVESWNIADPYGEDPATYQRILEDLESRIARLAEHLRTAQRVATS
jgi:protein-tyrosine-phosphatase